MKMVKAIRKGFEPIPGRDYEFSRVRNGQHQVVLYVRMPDGGAIIFGASEGEVLWEHYPCGWLLALDYLKRRRYHLVSEEPVMDLNRIRTIWLAAARKYDLHCKRRRKK